MPSEKELYEMHQARLDEINDSGYPLWMLELYENAQPTPPSEQKEPEDPRDYIDHDDLPF